MRNLFLALILANLAFAAWHTWFAKPPHAIATARVSAPGITLVSELPEDARAALDRSAQPAVQELPLAAEGSFGAEGIPAAEQFADASRCISVGPFRELAQTTAAAANLRTAGYAPAQRVADEDVWMGYWVYIEAIATEAEANDILTKIRARGVTDAYLIPNSDSGNLVSLGVFSEDTGVERRREEMRALGYEPTVVDRTRRATVYWVDVVLAPNQSLDFEALQTPGRIIRLEQRVCASAPE